jgi:uncharacterized phage protein (TIGR01671 family)
MKNRTIEFRAWDERTKTMIATGFNVIGETTMFGMIDEYIMKHPCDVKSSLLRFNDIIITQFTGLHDRNGKKIFEGDILDADGTKCTVIHNERNASFCMKCAYHYQYFDDDCTVDNITVLGNIFEHPNLIAQ